MSGQSPYMSAAQYGYPSNFQQRDNRYATNSNVETTMAYNRRPSLLAGYHNHFTSSPERTSLAPYVFSLSTPVSMGPHVDEQSKRSRYPTTIPLSIDVKKEQPLYQPQTEAISPILDEPKMDSNIRDTTVLRNSISKLESDIEITMKKLHRAKLSQNEIKSQADRSAADEEENDDRDDVFKTNGSQTLIEKILHDNRKKSEDGQKVFNQLHNNNIDVTIPLYQEPSDLESIEKIRTQYMNVMKNRLINLFKKSRERYMCRTKFESEKYDEAYQQWQKSIEKDEKMILAKDISTYRETFEKTFPELRKAREDKEKKHSTQTPTDVSLPSTEQPAQIPSNSIEQDNEGGGGGEEGDEKMRKSSVIPPIMYDTWQRKHQYFNQNGLIKGDAAVFYKEHTKMPYWSPEEKQIFIEKFTQSPKNFGYISSFLENKATEQCVQCYYMTKKTENYKNLLRKQSQANKRRAKQNTTTTTMTTVTSSTTIETTLVTKVTSNTIVSLTSQQILGAGQDAERSIDRIENDEERRDINSGDTNDEKRSNKNRCQLLSCTTEKGGKKKNRKNRLRAFPTKWNELSKEYREEIRRSLQIPSDVQRCCTRCYEKLIIQVRQRHSNQPAEDDDESTTTGNQNSKHDEEEWNETEIDAFTQALDKFNHDWTQIAEYVHRSEDSCRAFYRKQRKTISPIDDPNNDEDNGSISGSELGQTKQANDDNVLKTINDDSNDSTHGMVIDEGEEQTSVPVEKNTKSIPSTTNLTTITSLVEKEISKTLNETEKRAANNTFTTSPERSIHNNTTTQPPPLVTLNKSRSPATHYQYPSHPQQQYLPKGSIMRGTPISSSTPTNKPVAIDISSTHSHHYNNPRNEYSQHKSPKILDRNVEQQHLLQQQHAAYMRHYSQQQQQQQQYLQQQQQQQQHQQQQQQQHKTQTTKIEPPSTDTFETLRADFVTSKYLTTTHSPSHERQHRTGPDQRSPSQPSPSISQPLLPSPATIAPPTATSSVQSSSHSHHSQQQAALLAASQLLASSGVYSQDLIASGLLPYASYYGSLPASAPFLFDPRLMHEYAAAANNEQLKAEHHKAAMRLSRQHHHQPPSVHGHSPPDPSYPTHATKRHSHDLGYSTSDYPTSVWRTQNMNNPQQQQQQQVHPQMKLNSGHSENPLLKLNDMSRHSSARTAERTSGSPDDYHHRMNQPRTVVESPSIHFQRVEAHNHHKSSHEKSNPNLHYTDHSTDGNPLNYMRQTPNVHKLQTSHHSPHRHHHHNTTSNNRALVPPLQNSQISPHHPAYLIHSHHHPPVDTVSTQQQQQQKSPHHYQSHYSQQQQQQQQRPSHHNESIKNTKESMSIQEFMNKNVHEFVSSTNNDNKNSNTDPSSHEPSNNRLTRPHQASNSDQPILIDGDDDSNLNEQSDITNKSNTESEMPERRRDSSIKKILSNQPLEKPEYVEINQKVQNSTAGPSKVHPTNEQTGIERSNSTSTRTRSRGSITMRMLMGSSDIYADGKAQPMATNDEQSNKRPASPHDKGEKIEYLIRGELDRACPPLVKHDETPNIFQKTSSNQSQQNSSKRLRASPKDDEQHPSYESTTNVRDPFALQPHSKIHHQQLTSATNSDKNWQSYVQQQQYHLANSYTAPFATRTSRPTGSITQGSPISPSLRLSTDQQQYSTATNNQLVNPRYPYYMNKNEQQSSPSRQSSTSPHDHSPKTKLARKLNQTHSSPSDAQHESSLSTSGDHSSSLKSPLTNANTSNTPPMVASPTASNSSTHPLKKRLISEYELEQQRNSPVISTEEISNTSNVDIPKNDTEDVSNAEVAADETVSKPVEETENST